MDRWKGKVALVTGASTGIGAAISKSLVKEGVRVVGVARNLKRIQDLSKECEKFNSGGILYAMKCDVTKDEEVYALFKEIKTKYGKLDICVNNAGMSYHKSLMNGNPDEWRNILNLNVVALCLCSQLAVKAMQESGQDSGQIVNISSMSGHRMTNPVDNFYASSKNAVRVITEGFRKELRGMSSHIRVTSISPGMIDTEFHARSRGVSEVAAKDVVSYEMMEAEDIAEAVIYALSAHPRVDVNDILMRPTEQMV